MWRRIAGEELRSAGPTFMRGEPIGANSSVPEVLQELSEGRSWQAGDVQGTDCREATPP